MKRVCVITGTRAEYGLLYPLIKLIHEDNSLELQLIVSGTHLKKKYGYTKKEIINDGFPIMAEFDIFENENERNYVSKAMANVLLQFSEYLIKHTPDIAIILGDRYEMMAFAIALTNEKIPIAHLNGGETTEGALDEVYRHCITKMSMYHFVNCDQHRKRVIQLGENPDRVFNVGDTCIDNVVNQKLLLKNEIYAHLGLNNILDNDNMVIVTYHPVTLEEDSLRQVKILVNVLKKHNEYFYLFTKSNADMGGEKINSYLQNVIYSWENAMLVDSLGRVEFLSALKYSTMMIGNSSSGIYEAPIFKIPTINIGNRQRGRIHGETVIDCEVDEYAINSALLKVQTESFRKKCMNSKNLFGDGQAAQRIIKIIKEKLNQNIDLKKKFYDLK